MGEDVSARYIVHVHVCVCVCVCVCVLWIGYLTSDPWTHVPVDMLEVLRFLMAWLATLGSLGCGRN